MYEIHFPNSRFGARTPSGAILVPTCLDGLLLIPFLCPNFPAMENQARNLQLLGVFGLSLLLVTGCAGPQAEPAGVEPEDDRIYYGSVIETEGAMDAAGLRTALEKEGRAAVRFEGEITATCPKKGCWMDVASGEDTVFVRFLDYGFFVPTEGAEGKRAVMEGEAFFDTLTVDARRHYAEDAGASEEEIEAITEPELRLAFTATGVMIQD